MELVALWLTMSTLLQTDGSSPTSENDEDGPRSARLLLAARFGSQSRVPSGLQRALSATTSKDDNPTNQQSNETLQLRNMAPVRPDVSHDEEESLVQAAATRMYDARTLAPEKMSQMPTVTHLTLTPMEPPTQATRRQHRSHRQRMAFGKRGSQLQSTGMPIRTLNMFGSGHLTLYDDDSDLRVRSASAGFSNLPS